MYSKELGMLTVASTARPDITADKATVLQVHDEKGDEVRLFRPSEIERLENEGYRPSLEGSGTKEPIKTYVFLTAEGHDVKRIVDYQLEHFKADFFLSCAERLIEVAASTEFSTGKTKVNPLWMLDALQFDLREANCNCPEVHSMVDRALPVLARLEFQRCVLPQYNLIVGKGFGEDEGRKLVRLSTNRVSIPFGDQYFTLGTLKIAGWEFVGASYVRPDDCKEQAGIAQNYFWNADPLHKAGIEAAASAFRIRERKTKTNQQYTWIVSEFTDRFYRNGNLAPLATETWVKVVGFPPGGGIVFEQLL